MKLSAFPLVAALTVAVLCLAPARGQQSGALEVGDVGPRAIPVDEFHPDRETPAEPSYGGRVIVHSPELPQSLNPVLENSGVVGWMLQEMHETLVLQDWELWDHRPNLCTHWDTEDQLVIEPAAAGRYPAARRIGEGDRECLVLFGGSEEIEGGWRITPRSLSNPLEQPIDVAADDVIRLERGTVFTFYLKDGLKWHDGHVFDADDVHFTWQLYRNPFVRCDATRSNHLKTFAGEVLNRLTVRFFYENQYFKALEAVGGMPILPRHLYDPNDPDHADYDSEARLTEEDLGRAVNENAHNRELVGLGPYRLVSFETQYVEAERFDGYAVSERTGYLDTIRWRFIASDDAAFQALINGELDFFARMGSEDYFGEVTASTTFTDRFYKGYVFTGSYGFTGWNMKRPQLADRRVRRALAHAFDSAVVLRSVVRGLGILVTGPQHYFGPGYDHSVQPLEYDPELARELLAEAGWYDRDGDGIVDQDGVALEIELLMPTGNLASQDYGLRLQEALGKIGVKLELRTAEWASFLDQALDRDFDAVSLAWNPPLESDPGQVWHSRNDHPGTSNLVGFNDPEADRLIEALQIELDGNKRAELHHKLHRLIHDQQPYLFGYNAPLKYAMNLRIRGFQGFNLVPGYSIRRWFYPAGTEGTRASAKK